MLTLCESRTSHFVGIFAVRILASHSIGIVSRKSLVRIETH